MSGKRVIPPVVPLHVQIEQRRVRELIERFFFLTDRKAWHSAESLFVHGEIEADPGSLVSGASTCRTGAQLVAVLAQQLRARTTTRHAGNVYEISMAGDLAVARVRGSAWHQTRVVAGASGLWESWGIYHFTCRRSPRGWRLASFRYVPRYTRGDEAARLHA